MARTAVQTLRGLIADDESLGLVPPDPVSAGQTLPSANSSAPLLSLFVTDYVAKRSADLDEERADLYRAVVRDLIAVTSDKPVTAYDHSDAEAFESVLRKLPPKLVDEANSEEVDHCAGRSQGG